MPRRMSFGAATLIAVMCIAACGADPGSATNPGTESSVSASGTETGVSQTPTGDDEPSRGEPGGNYDRAEGFPYMP